MPFQLSAGINTSEIDLTTIVPAVATTDGAIGGVFRWGPVEQRVLIDSESTLVSHFGKPTNLNAETWFTAANFLGYGNRLHVSRAANTVGTSPVVTTANTTSGQANLIVASVSALTTGMILISSSNNIVTSPFTVGATILAIYTSSKEVTLSVNSTASMLNGTAQFVTNTAFAAVANTGTVPDLAGQIAKNRADFLSKDISTYDTDTNFVARYPGELGNSMRISVCSTPDGYTSNIDLSNTTLYSATSESTLTTFTMAVNSSNATFVSTTASSTSAASTRANTAATALVGAINVNDILQVGSQKLKVTAISYAGSPDSGSSVSAANATVTVSFADVLKQSANVIVSSTSSPKIAKYWEFYNTVGVAPGKSDYQKNFGNNTVTSDEMHIVLVDDAGKFSGVPGTVLEVYKAVSRATDSKNIDGAGNYYKDVINSKSNYIYAIYDVPGIVSNTAISLVNATTTTKSIAFTNGKDGADESNISMSNLAAAYDQFASAEASDISLVLSGKNKLNSYAQLVNYLIDNIAEVRKDCVVFASPSKEDVVGKSGSTASDAIIATKANMRPSSYAVMDSGYKYMYDRYNDLYRWIPLNGDVAGMCARTDSTNDAWWSPAGINRGQLKNLVRLAYNPSKAERDVLYAASINPVVTFPGQGTILYGDKTLLGKPSAFDRINVRRLFIVLEKAIARASRSTLFEFNDTFTRSQFRNLVVPYLRDIQSRRGITDFLVVCDETNNTPEVVDRNEFIGDIYIKPARSINFIQLNFVAVRSGVAFSEVVGQF